MIVKGERPSRTRVRSWARHTNVEKHRYVSAKLANFIVASSRVYVAQPGRLCHMKSREKLHAFTEERCPRDISLLLWHERDDDSAAVGGIGGGELGIGQVDSGIGPFDVGGAEHTADCR